MGYAIPLPNKERHARLETRKRRRVDDAYVVDAVEDGRGFESGVACQTCVPMVDVACQTSETKEDHTEELQQLQQEYQCLQYEASQKSEVSFSADALKSKEQKLKFYTG